jgi:hypothetical protein
MQKALIVKHYSILFLYVSKCDFGYLFILAKVVEMAIEKS